MNSGRLDPNRGLGDLYTYELWKKVIEMYLRTQLPKFEDNLIALAIVAKLFQESLFKLEPTYLGRQKYVTGFLSRHLESQFLWCVNNVYNDDGEFSSPLGVIQKVDARSLGPQLAVHTASPTGMSQIPDCRQTRFASCFSKQ